MNTKLSINYHQRQFVLESLHESLSIISKSAELDKTVHHRLSVLVSLLADGFKSFYIQRNQIDCKTCILDTKEFLDQQIIEKCHIPNEVIENLHGLYGKWKEIKKKLKAETNIEINLSFANKENNNKLVDFLKIAKNTERFLAERLRTLTSLVEEIQQELIGLEEKQSDSSEKNYLKLCMLLN